MKLPLLGSVEWITLDEPGFEGVEFGVKHVGPKLRDEWTYKANLAQLTNTRELTKLRKEFTEAEAPELYGLAALSPAGGAAFAELAVTVAEDSLAGVRGVEGVAEDDTAGAVRAFGYLTLAGKIQFMGVAMGLQGLHRREFPAAAGASDVGSEDAPTDGGARV